MRKADLRSSAIHDTLFWSTQTDASQYIRRNPSDNVMKELKQTRAKAEKRRALTQAEQDLFLNYLKRSEQYRHWYPIFAVMVGSG